jgi:hypothetical protein
MTNKIKNMKMKNPEQSPGNQSREALEEKRRGLAFILIDFKNYIGYGGRAPKPPEPDDLQGLERFFEHCSDYPYKTIEEAYSRDGYNPDFLPDLQKYCPEVVAELNNIVRQLNDAVKAKDIEVVKSLLIKGNSYLDSLVEQYRDKK